MQEKINKRLLASLLMLSALTIVAVIWTGREDGNDINRELFRMASLDKVDRIVLNNASGANAALHYNGSAWMVNDSLKADPNMIKVLFATLAQIEPKRPVTGSVGDSIKTAMQASAVKVELYSGNELVRSFQAGGNVQKTRAYILFNNDVYLAHIPGYRVYVSGIFELDESGFRDKYAFGFRWENFQSLEAQFPGRPAENFRVSMKGNYFAVDGLPETDTTRLYNFLDDVARLTVDGYLKELPEEQDSSFQLMTLRIFDIGKRTYDLVLLKDSGLPNIYGRLNGELVYFQRDKVASLFRPRSFFVRARE